jgi:hypothetical protein
MCIYEKSIMAVNLDLWASNISFELWESRSLFQMAGESVAAVDWFKCVQYIFPLASRGLNRKRRRVSYHL